MRPRVGCRNLVSRLKHVVLPAPFGPISAWMVPRATRSATPFTAVNPANSLVRSSVSRIASVPADNDVPSPRHHWWRRGSGPRSPDRGRTAAARVASWQRSHNTTQRAGLRAIVADVGERGAPKGGPPGGGGNRPGGGSDRREGVEGG